MLTGPVGTPAHLPIHKGSFGLFPGVQRVGLRRPQAHILKAQPCHGPGEEGFRAHVWSSSV